MATLILVLPGSSLRLALGHGDHNTAAKAAALRQSLGRSRPLGLARRLMAHDWSAAEVVVCCVFVLTLAAGVLAILVAGYVLGVTRPTIADQALPWVLGASIAVGMAYSWERRKGEPLLAWVVLICGIVSVLAIAVMKAEASVANPAVYLQHHPVKDKLFAPTWVAVEIGAFAGCSIASAGFPATVHALGAFIGLLIEICAAVLAGLTWLGEFVIRGLLVISRLVVGLLLIPAELLYLAVRRKVGTDLDGVYYLPLPIGGLLTRTHSRLSSRSQTRKEESQLNHKDSQKISLIGIGYQGSRIAPDAHASVAHALHDKERKGHEQLKLRNGHGAKDVSLSPAEVAQATAGKSPDEANRHVIEHMFDRAGNVISLRKAGDGVTIVADDEAEAIAGPLRSLAARHPGQRIASICSCGPDHAANGCAITSDSLRTLPVTAVVHCQENSPFAQVNSPGVRTRSWSPPSTPSA